MFRGADGWGWSLGGRWVSEHGGKKKGRTGIAGGGDLRNGRRVVGDLFVDVVDVPDGQRLVPHVALLLLIVHVDLHIGRRRRVDGRRGVVRRGRVAVDAVVGVRDGELRVVHAVRVTVTP